MTLDELIAQGTNPQEFTRLCNSVFTDIYGDSFVERFSREILGLEWSDIFFVSEESSVLDFTIGGVATTRTS